MSNLNRSNFQGHPFHLVSPSPWPLFTCISLLTLTTSGVLTMHGFSNSQHWLPCALICLIASMSFWFRNVISEGSYLGYHTLTVQRGLNMGVALFIVSEGLFFLAIFWAYFHSALSPSLELGAQWPPYYTFFLLLSGALITYFQHSLILLTKTFLEFLVIILKINPFLIIIFIHVTLVVFNTLGSLISCLDYEGFLNCYINSEIGDGYSLNSSGSGYNNTPGGFHHDNLGNAGPAGPGHADAGQPVDNNRYWKRYLLNYLVDKKSTWVESDGNIIYSPPLSEQSLIDRRANLQVKDFGPLFSNTRPYTFYAFPNSYIVRYWQENPRAFDMIPANTSVTHLINQIRIDLNR